MSVVVVPGQFHSAPHPAGKLANTLLSVAVAGLSDPARFRRGKQYLADHAVSRLEIAPGVLQAVVSGSMATPYQVTVLVPLLPPFDQATSDALRQQLTRLTPEPNELDARCTCRDPEAPCKHAVAALLAMAAELVGQPKLLVQWRCDTADTPRAQIGSRASTRRHLRLVDGTGDQSDERQPSDQQPGANQGARDQGTHQHHGEHPAPPPVRPPQPPPDPWSEPAWLAFLGSLPLPALPAVPDSAAPTGRSMVGSIDVGAVVRTALDALTSHR